MNIDPMKQLRLILSLSSLIIATTLLSQRVTDVQAAVKNDKVLIGYQIKGLKCEQSIEGVKFYVSKDGGNTFIGPLNNISGDAEDGIRNGKHIVEWDALKELPFSDETMVFDVRADIKEKRRKRSIMISLVSNATTPLGGRIGQLGKVSWYIEGRSSLLAGQTVDYSYRNGAITDLNDTVDGYQFTGNKGWKAYSAIIGATFQLSCNLFLFLGAGYGYEDYIKEVEIDDNNSHHPEGKYWAKDEERSLQGAEFDGGLIFKYKALIISGGVTTINFDKTNWTVGLGVAF